MAKLALSLIFLGLAFFDGYTQMNYGDPDLKDRFETVKSYFPDSYTMNDIVSAFILKVDPIVEIRACLRSPHLLDSYLPLRLYYLLQEVLFSSQPRLTRLKLNARSVR